MLKRLHRIYVSCLIISSLSFYVHAAPVTLVDNFELVSKWKYETIDIQPIDIDADHIDELFVRSNEQVDVKDIFQLSHHESFRIPADRYYNITPLVTGRLDSLAFLAHYFNQDSSVNHLLIRGNNRTALIENYLVFTGKDRDHDGDYHQSIWPIGFINSNNDKQYSLYVLNSGYDCAERGLMAVEPRTGQIAWEYLIGPQVVNPIIFDYNNDGKQEILFGSYAPKNGAEFNGTRDDKSYLFMLDNEGRLLWKKYMGPYFTGVLPSVGDVNGDNQQEIVIYCFGTNPQFDELNIVQLLDAKDGAVKKIKAVGNGFINTFSEEKSVCHDLDDDGIDEIVIGNTDGNLYVLDQDLNILDVSQPFKIPVDLLDIGDMDLNGSKEIIITTADNRLVILDNLLQVLCQRVEMSRTDYRVVKDRSKIYLLARRQLSNDLYGFELMELQNYNYRKYLIDKRHSLPIYFLLFSFLLFIVYYIRNLFYGKAAKNILLSFLHTSELSEDTLIMKKNGKIVKIGNKWHEILHDSVSDWSNYHYRYAFSADKHKEFLTAFDEVVAKKYKKMHYHLDGQGQYSVTFIKIPFQGIYFVMLTDLTEKHHLQQIERWVQVAQRLAHGIKNPLTTVQLNAEELHHNLVTKHGITATDIDDYFKSLNMQVNRLKKMTDGFMRFIEFEKIDLKPVDLNVRLRELITLWQPEKAKKINIAMELEDNIPPALIDDRQFEEALKNIFYNALESMTEGGQIVISTHLVQVFIEEIDAPVLKEYVEIQLRDTGEGIPSENLDRVTQPYFTRNKAEGTGLGLSIVKKIMEAHDGGFVIESEVGVGTTVTLRFRTMAG
ncbi:hypothetical protein JXB12_03540 [candidate division KSB1 bacterium]|nr:hypothetical protein [candidate division KSB1 bacterium]